MRVDDVTLKLADADEDEQRERGHVDRLRKSDGEPEDRASSGPITGTISTRLTNPPARSQYFRPTR